MGAVVLKCGNKGHKDKLCGHALAVVSSLVTGKRDFKTKSFLSKVEK